MGFLDHDGPIAFAHRGYAVDGDENSMTAFQRAVDLGYRYLETDVRVTADGVALAFHDAVLDRVTDARGVVSELTWREVRTARIAGREPIPLLADVLTTWPDVRVNIDVKSQRAVAPTLDVVRRTAALERICLAAFSDRRVGQLRRELGPGLCTALGPREAAALRLAASVRLRPRALGGALDVGGRRCAQVPAGVGRLRLVDARYLVAARAAGVAVHVWTVNDRAEMVRLLDLGVDGIMTDRADVLREVLRERGLWAQQGREA